MRIIICDDEEKQIASTKALLSEWAKGRDFVLQVDTFNSAESLLFAYEDDKAVEILLLDIQMGGMDGVALAKAIRQQDKAVQIVFISGYREYILDGYDVEALHYLLKPLERQKLFAILDKAVEKLAYQEKALFISHSGENIRIPLYKIRYFEVMHNYVSIHITDGKSYSLKKPLKEFEESLDESFFRVGRSYIVNLLYIQKNTKTEVHMSCGAVIPLSRGMYAPLNQAMIKLV